MRLRQATLCAAFALLATGGAHAVDLSARLQRQCPATVAWTNAHPSVEISQNQKNSYDAAHRASEPALRKELATRFARDQKIRHELIASDYSAVARRAMMADDASNVAWLKLLIEQRGFPSIAQVGFEGVSHAFILVQHATRDPALQARVLREIKPRLRSDGISNNEYALLFDRVRVEQGKLQVYGSQFVISTKPI